MTPKGYEVGEDYEILGFSSTEANSFAHQALTRRLKVIGVSLGPADADAVPA